MSLDDDENIVIGEVLNQIVEKSSSDKEVPKTNGHTEQTFDFNAIEEEYNDDADTNSSFDKVEIVDHIIPSDFVPSEKLNGVGGGDMDDEEERDYVVEKILDKKIDAKGCALYLVKWEGFLSSQNTWEPIQNLVECDKKMEEFEAQGALRLAKKFKSSEHNGNTRNNNDNANGDKSKSGTDNKRRMSSKYREFPIMDVMGMTQINDERYYLVSIANSTQKTFIRASLAKRVFPSKVIDFYVKNLRWKQKVDDPNLLHHTSPQA